MKIAVNKSAVVGGSRMSSSLWLMALVVLVFSSNCFARQGQGPGQDDDLFLIPAPAVEIQDETSPLSGANDLDWLNEVTVGYDGGFVFASTEQVDLGVDHYPFRMKINGWGQLRHTVFQSHGANVDKNQFGLKRARLIFDGSAFTNDFEYFIQLDGRSSSGDDMRLLDFVMSYDIGHHLWGLDQDVIGFKTGKYKMPFTMARMLSGREFEFTDRSMASMFFDVNRSLAWGLYGKTRRTRIPVYWEAAIFNGFVTGGAETGSSGTIDSNFAYAARFHSYPTGDWGAAELADFECHQTMATRIGAAYANSTMDRIGSTEFNSVRVVDSGRTLSNLLTPLMIDEYSVKTFAIDASAKYRGGSLSMEYYFRTVGGFQGGAMLPDLYDHGFWFQMGKFIVPKKVELLARWSHVNGDSGTLGTLRQNADEVAGGLVWYFREQHAKLTMDATYLDGAPIKSSSLDVAPRDRGWFMRSQIQFSF